MFTIKTHCFAVSPTSHPSVTRLFWSSHPPLAEKRKCSDKLSWRAVTGHFYITSWPHQIPVFMPKITTILALQHGQKRRYLTSGFPPSPSWEVDDCSHPPPMAHREYAHSNKYLDPWSTDTSLLSFINVFAHAYTVYHVANALETHATVHQQRSSASFA